MSRPKTPAERLQAYIEHREQYGPYDTIVLGYPYSPVYFADLKAMVLQAEIDTARRQAVEDLAAEWEALGKTDVAYHWSAVARFLRERAGLLGESS